MGTDYRRRLAANLRALLIAKNIPADRLKAPYLDGPKKGKLVSARTINYTLSDDAGKSGVGLDVLAALAAALGVEAYHLLVPHLDPFSQPTTKAEDWIESEVKRRVDAALPRAIKAMRALEAASGDEGRRHDSGISIADRTASVKSTTRSGRPKAATHARRKTAAR